MAPSLFLSSRVLVRMGKYVLLRIGKYVLPRMHWPDEALYHCLEAGAAIRTSPPGDHGRTRPLLFWVSLDLNP
jgi:hypothetical protein